MGQSLAILINPKTRELVEVRREGSQSVRLYYPGTDVELGRAYWDASETFEVGNDTYRRSHSPNSGVEQGKGFGVCLYSGLCLRAYSDTSAVGIASSDGGVGHSSRSRSADEFWERAVENGLAEEDTTEGDLEERDTEYCPDDISCEETGDDECVEVTDTSCVRIDYQVGGGEIEFQYMPAWNIVEKGLVFKYVDMNAEPEGHELPPPELIAGLDLSHCYDPELVEDTISIIVEAGLGTDYIERMLSTVPAEVYKKSSASKQLKLPFTKNKSYTPNRKVEKALDEMWDAFYGGLQDM
jgi:hypothetical protein